MSKASYAIAVLAIIVCVLGALVYVLFPSGPPNSACWKKEYTPSYNPLTYNETWATMILTTERDATVTVNFSTYVVCSIDFDVALKWDGYSYWNSHQDAGDGAVTHSNFTEFTSFPAGSHILTVSLAKGEWIDMRNTFLEVCVTYN